MEIIFIIIYKWKLSLRTFTNENYLYKYFEIFKVVIKSINSIQSSH